MGGLRGGRGGGGGGGFEEESDSFDAIDDARSDNEGCELFFGGGGGGGGDESVGCCVVASMFSLWRGVPRLAMNYVAPRAAPAAPLSEGLCSSVRPRRVSGCGFDTPCARAEQWASSAAINVSQRPS